MSSSPLHGAQSRAELSTECSTFFHPKQTWQIKKNVKQGLVCHHNAVFLTILLFTCIEQSWTGRGHCHYRGHQFAHLESNLPPRGTVRIEQCCSLHCCLVTSLYQLFCLKFYIAYHQLSTAWIHLNQLLLSGPEWSVSKQQYFVISPEHTKLERRSKLEAWP